ncbi:DUF3289 family protein [Taibaiella soli]|uniref:DUF3289 family protein n=1 Tax=Taibaiella soli TaxID=1649169 RepID=A0A2W2C286_9BACT|nr:DUF3289 family protein [Taibaiella soli]PZF74193.1 hypothetical protein DN068_04025 [Taibaiella soli]
MGYQLTFWKKLVKSDTDKYYDAVGQIPNDWRYNDYPPIHGLDLVQTMKKTDQELKDDLWALISWTSTGNLQVIASHAFRQFTCRMGGKFSDNELTNIVKNDDNTVAWVSKFKNDFDKELQNAKGNIDKVIMRAPSRPVFDDMGSRIGGLGILIHQVWAYEVWLTKFSVDPKNGMYTGNLEIRFYDHFGLDGEDVMKGNKRWLQPYGSEDGFKAWWVLQHYRGYPPLLTEIIFNTPIFGKIRINQHAW